MGKSNNYNTCGIPKEHFLDALTRHRNYWIIDPHTKPVEFSKEVFHSFSRLMNEALSPYNTHQHGGLKVCMYCWSIIMRKKKLVHTGCPILGDIPPEYSLTELFGKTDQTSNERYRGLKALLGWFSKERYFPRSYFSKEIDHSTNNGVIWKPTFPKLMILEDIKHKCYSFYVSPNIDILDNCWRTTGSHYRKKAKYEREERYDYALYDELDDYGYPTYPTPSKSFRSTISDIEIDLVDDDTHTSAITYDDVEVLSSPYVCREGTPAPMRYVACRVCGVCDSGSAMSGEREGKPCTCNIEDNRDLKSSNKSISESKLIDDVDLSSIDETDTESKEMAEVVKRTIGNDRKIIQSEEPDKDADIGQIHEDRKSNSKSTSQIKENEGMLGKRHLVETDIVRSTLELFGVEKLKVNIDGKEIELDTKKHKFFCNPPLLNRHLLKGWVERARQYLPREKKLDASSKN